MGGKKLKIFIILLLGLILFNWFRNTDMVMASNEQFKLYSVNKTLYANKETYTLSFKYKIGSMGIVSDAEHLSNNYTITFKSSNQKVATVNKKGVVAPLNEGATYITATFKFPSGKKHTDKIKITVKKYITVKSVKLSVDNNYIEEGVNFNVNVKFTPNNSTYKEIVWTVVNDNKYASTVQHISGSEFRARNTGTATIRAYVKDINKTFELKVNIKEKLSDFYVDYNNKKVTTLNTNVGMHLQIQCKFGREPYETVSDKFQYKIEDASIATVDTRGQVTALKEGKTNIIITAVNGKSIKCSLIVEKPYKYALDTLYADKISESISLVNYPNEFPWACADNTYIFEMSDGNIGVFNQVASGKGQYINLYKYDESFKFVSLQKIEIPYSVLGSIHQGQDGYYYIVVGQDNPEEDNNKIVYSIIKYNDQFNEITRTNINGSQCYTTEPFAAGSCNIDMNGTTLVVHTSRLRYTSEDGFRHQSNITFMIDTSTMQLLYVGSMFPYNHVSHSFNQFVKFDGNNLIYVDHGDGYPRSVVMQTHVNFSTNGWSDEYFNRPIVIETDLLKIVGEVGDNETGTKVNNFAIGKFNNIVAGVSIPHSIITGESLKTYSTQNVYVSFVNKSGESSKLIWLTDYKENGNRTASNLNMLKIDEDKFALIYQIEEKSTGDDYFGLTLIDSSGNILLKKEYPGYISCSIKPIFYKNKIVWLEVDKEEWDYFQSELDKTFNRKFFIIELENE